MFSSFCVISQKNNARNWLVIAGIISHNFHNFPPLGGLGGSFEVFKLT